jgi:hypothetical protein
VWGGCSPFPRAALCPGARWKQKAGGGQTEREPRAVGACAWPPRPGHKDTRQLPLGGHHPTDKCLGPRPPGGWRCGSRSERDCKHNLLCGGEVQFSVKRQGLKSRPQRAIGRFSEILLSPSFQLLKARKIHYVKERRRHYTSR